MTEKDLNDVDKSISLYIPKLLNDECPSGSSPYHILNTEDLRIHAEIRKKWDNYLRDAKFLINMRRSPSGYFYASDRAQNIAGKLIEIDVCCLRI